MRMKSVGLFFAGAVLGGTAAAAALESAVPADGTWPVLKSYDLAHQGKIAMPLGGIGTGTISLSGTGGLVAWEIRNNPDRWFTPCRNAVHPAFVVRTESAQGEVVARLLEGPLDPRQYEGEMGSAAPNHGYPRFTGCTFRAAYPLAQVELKDPAVPVEATLEAMNPLVPGDAEASGLPVALLRWKLVNRTSGPLKVSVAAAMPNPSEGKLAQTKFRAGGLAGVRFSGEGKSGAAADTHRGEFVVAVADGAGTVSLASDVRQPGWNDGLDQFWRRFVAKGDVGDTAAKTGEACGFGMVATAIELAPGETRRIPFVLAWRFPHRQAWSSRFHHVREGAFDAAEDVGNHYCRVWPTAVAAAMSFASRLGELEAATVRFVRSVADAKAPAEVREAALFNLSTFRCETCFRTADGHFFGWEGIFDKAGSCEGSCTHVWGYEHALVDLWPALAKDMCELQFGAAMATNGLINFRIQLPLAKSRDYGRAAADGQMQCIIKAYECWRKTGDGAWMRRLYPSVRRAMEFCWLPGGWDADRDGVMEGCQHNTMDVDYYGPNPQMEFLYLAALKALAAMAEASGEAAFAAECRGLAAKGGAWTEEHLFNGAYYEHEVRSAKGPWLKGTRAGVESADPERPDFQLGAGCLVDQLVGDYAARAVGLGPVADLEHARTATDTILRRNRREKGDNLFNPMRDYVFFGERSIRMAWYPEDRKPKTPFPYYPETMNGFEYVVAAWLAETGDFVRAAEVVRDIRERYDGLRRNPFDEIECGHHYVRSLASWTVFRAFCRSRRGQAPLRDEVSLRFSLLGDKFDLLRMVCPRSVPLNRARQSIPFASVRSRIWRGGKVRQPVHERGGRPPRDGIDLKTSWRRVASRPTPC